MLRGYSRVLVAVGCFSLFAMASTAQEVVHALAGVVKVVNASSNTIIVATDDGSDGVFSVAPAKVAVEFDKSVRSEAVAAGTFKNAGAQVIVYYYGVGGTRTVVALHDLGPGPFTKSAGTIVKYDKGQHSLSVEDASGAVEIFKIARSSAICRSAVASLVSAAFNARSSWTASRVMA